MTVWYAGWNEIIEYGCFSWWWAHSGPKHVQKGNKHTKKNCAPSWLHFQEKLNANCQFLTVKLQHYTYNTFLHFIDHHQGEHTSENKYKARSTSTLPSNVPYTIYVKVLNHQISMSRTVTSTVYGAIYSPHFIVLYVVYDNKTYYNVLM